MTFKVYETDKENPENKKKLPKENKYTEAQKQFIEIVEKVKNKYDLSWKNIAEIFGVHESYIHGWKSFNASYFMPISDKKLPVYINKIAEWLIDKNDRETAESFYMIVKNADSQNMLVTKQREKLGKGKPCPKEQEQFVETLIITKEKYNFNWAEIADILKIKESTIQGWKNYKASYFVSISQKRIKQLINKITAWLKEKNDYELINMFNIIYKDTADQKTQENMNHMDQTLVTLENRLLKTTESLTYHRNMADKYEKEETRLKAAVIALKEIKKAEDNKDLF